jgi:hypothetical protein
MRRSRHLGRRENPSSQADKAYLSTGIYFQVNTALSNPCSSPVTWGGTTLEMQAQVMSACVIYILQGKRSGLGSSEKLASGSIRDGISRPVYVI